MDCALCSEPPGGPAALTGWQGAACRAARPLGVRGCRALQLPCRASNAPRCSCAATLAAPCHVPSLPPTDAGRLLLGCRQRCQLPLEGSEAPSQHPACAPPGMDPAACAWTQLPGPGSQPCCTSVHPRGPPPRWDAPPHPLFEPLPVTQAGKACGLFFPALPLFFHAGCLRASGAPWTRPPRPQPCLTDPAARGLACGNRRHACALHSLPASQPGAGTFFAHQHFDPGHPRGGRPPHSAAAGPLPLPASFLAREIHDSAVAPGPRRRAKCVAPPRVPLQVPSGFGFLARGALGAPSCSHTSSVRG